MPRHLVCYGCWRLFGALRQRYRVEPTRSFTTFHVAGSSDDLTHHDFGDLVYGSEIVSGAKCTSPIQTYLKHIKARGEEAAEFLKEQLIEPGWQAKA